jgi:hypothetical protein
MKYHTTNLPSDMTLPTRDAKPECPKEWDEPSLPNVFERKMLAASLAQLPHCVASYPPAFCRFSVDGLQCSRLKPRCAKVAGRVRLQRLRLVAWLYVH